MAGFQLNSERLGVIILGVAAGISASSLGGFALGQFALAGIDPQLADTYRQHYAEQVAYEDHGLSGRVMPVADLGFESAVSSGARVQSIAFRDAGNFAQ